MTGQKKNPKICLVTDWCTNIGGGEKVVKAVSGIFPEATILTTVFDPLVVQRFFGENQKIKGSWLQKIPQSYKKHQWLLPFLNQAIESLDTAPYDLILSFSSCVAKNIKKNRSDQVHICYIHTPVRYGWDMTYDYRVKNLPFGIRFLAKKYLAHLKNYDYKTRNNPDLYISNSSETASRVSQYYQKKSKICYPPFDPNEVTFGLKKSDYYLGFGRMVAYKRFDLLVETFCDMPQKRLIIAGEGPERKILEKFVASKAVKNITFLGRVSETKKKQLFSEAKAFLLPQKEDAGITQIEAMASGTPVIAFEEGGILDVLQTGVNGIFFPIQTADSLKQKIEFFETTASNFDPEVIKKSVEPYSLPNFQQRYKTLLSEFLKER